MEEIENFLFKKLNALMCNKVFPYFFKIIHNFVKNVNVHVSIYKCPHMHKHTHTNVLDMYYGYHEKREKLMIIFYITNSQ